jgi:peptidoglycan/xylan/chitin deacetylase (PgdA/CDA1 family)
MTALMYHDIVTPGAEDASGFPGPDAASYKVSLERFTEHLDAIAARTGGQLFSSRAATVGPLALTFDDGGISALTAADYLELYGFRGYFFVTANYIGTPGFLDPVAMRDLDRRGHIVGSHSCSHPLRIGHLSWRRLLDEWTRSHEIISDVLGHPISIGSIPGGDYAPLVARAAAESGFTELFTSEPTAADRRASGVLLHGRFTVRRWTGAATAARLATGDFLPAARQALVWNVTKLGKRFAGAQYLRLRRLLMGSSASAQWGDSAIRNDNSALTTQEPVAEAKH